MLGFAEYYGRSLDAFNDCLRVRTAGGLMDGAVGPVAYSLAVSPFAHNIVAQATMSRIMVLLVVTAFASHVRADNPESTATILIPTLYSGPGAHASTWWSFAVVNNHASVLFQSAGVGFIVYDCPIPEGCVRSEVPSGKFGEIVSPRPAGGLLLHTSPEVARDLAFHGRFGHGQLEELSDGMQLPIVGDPAFVRGPLRLPYVVIHRTAAGKRITLRVYGVDARPGTAVRLERRDWYLPSSDPLDTKVIQLHVPASPPGVPAPLYPAYAQVALHEAFPGGLSQGGYVFNITVVPLPLESGEIPRIWALLTSTDNVTQDVTLQQP